MIREGIKSVKNFELWSISINIGLLSFIKANVPDFRANLAMINYFTLTIRTHLPIAYGIVNNLDVFH